MQNVQLGTFDIGGGVFATQAWVNDGPIVLVTTESRDGRQSSRLDLQKAMFIDPLPGSNVRTADDVSRLIVRVRQRAGAARG